MSIGESREYKLSLVLRDTKPAPSAGTAVKSFLVTSLADPVRVGGSFKKSKMERSYMKVHPYGISQVQKKQKPFFLFLVNPS